MSTHRKILTVYKQCLRLYPAEFRGRYEAEMLRVAADMLHDAPGKKDKVSVVAWLFGDAVWSGLRTQHEYNKRASTRRPSTVRQMAMAALHGVQIVGLGVLGYLWLNMLLFAFDDMVRLGATRISVAGLAGQFVVYAVMVGIAPLAFVMLRKVPHMTAWSRVLWAAGLSVLGFAGFMLFGGAGSALVRVPDWLVAAAYAALFYWALLRIRLRLGRLYATPRLIRNLWQ